MKFEFGRERIYIKSVAIKIEHLKFLDVIRGKKSKAGKLDEIIEFYKEKKKI